MEGMRREEDLHISLVGFFFSFCPIIRNEPASFCFPFHTALFKTKMNSTAMGFV